MNLNGTTGLCQTDHHHHHHHHIPLIVHCGAPPPSAGQKNSTQLKPRRPPLTGLEQDRTGRAGQWSKRTLKQWSLDRIKSEEQPQKGGWTSEATSFVRQPLSTAFPIHIPWFFISSQLRPKPPSHSPDRPSTSSSCSLPIRPAFPYS